MLGILIICLTLGYSCIEFNKFLGLLNRDEFSGFTNTAWLKLLGIIILILISSSFIYIGLGKENIHNKNGSLIGWWLSASFVIPFVILLYWIAYSTGNWPGG